MKRFYKVATVGPDRSVLLDGRPIKTPAHNVLRLPTNALAEGVAREWSEQGETVSLHAMSMTKLAHTALDRVSAMRGEVIDQILAFGGSDLLCYRAEAPARLVALQEYNWQPLLDWAAERFGLRLFPVTGIMHRAQPSEAFEQTRQYLEAQSSFVLAGLQAATGLLGSLVLGLALLEHRVDEDEAFRLSRLDETFQAEQWGRDAEAEARAVALAAELDAIARFMSLSRA